MITFAVPIDKAVFVIGTVKVQTTLKSTTI